MKFTSFFTGLVLAFPFALGAALPAADNAVVGGSSSLLARDFTVVNGQEIREMGDRILGRTVNRESFNKDIVAELSVTYPSLNWIICCVDHTPLFDGTEDKDWGNVHYATPLVGTFGKTCDIYGFGSGQFVLTGDGGYRNWAYSGRQSGMVEEKDSKGKVIKRTYSFE